MKKRNRSFKESKKIDLPEKMTTCLLHKDEPAVSWHGHVHYRNIVNGDIQAGWCVQCSDFDEWDMMVQGDVNGVAHCQDCFGALKKIR